MRGAREEGGGRREEGGGRRGRVEGGVEEGGGRRGGGVEGGGWRDPLGHSVWHSPVRWPEGTPAHSRGKRPHTGWEVSCKHTKQHYTIKHEQCTSKAYS